MLLIINLTQRLHQNNVLSFECPLLSDCFTISARKTIIYVFRSLDILRTHFDWVSIQL
jgi:hypothetical protein